MLSAELVMVAPREAVRFVADALEEVEDGRVMAFQRNRASTLDIEYLFTLRQRGYEELSRF